MFLSTRIPFKLYSKLIRKKKFFLPHFSLCIHHDDFRLELKGNYVFAIPLNLKKNFCMSQWNVASYSATNQCTSLVRNKNDGFHFLTVIHLPKKLNCACMI